MTRELMSCFFRTPIAPFLHTFSLHQDYSHNHLHHYITSTTSIAATISSSRPPPSSPSFPSSSPSPPSPSLPLSSTTPSSPPPSSPPPWQKLLISILHHHRSLHYSYSTNLSFPLISCSLSVLSYEKKISLTLII